MRVETKECRHGTLSFFKDDTYVGLSLDQYGDYSEDEVNVFKSCLQSDDIAIEVGSNIGALTVPMAKLCKTVYAFEPQPQTFDMLLKNVIANGLADKVLLHQVAIGDEDRLVYMPNLEHVENHNYGGIEITTSGDNAVVMKRLDDLVDDKVLVKFIKIDAEGSELNVLKGAEQLIERCRPIMYIENDRKEKSAELVGWLIDHGYRCFWHRVPLYYYENFNKNEMNLFGNTVSLMMVCIPEEKDIKIKNLDEVDDHRVDEMMYHREKARVLKRLKKPEEDHYEVRALLAHFCNLMGDEEEARVYLAENLKEKPDHTSSLMVKALIELQAGNYKEGWPGYELRYAQRDPTTFGWRKHDAPHWDGSPTNERILVWCEQGFGDTIMFGRFMDEVLRRAPNAIMEVPPQMYELFEISNVVPRGNLYRLGRTLPSYAYHVAIPSLPALFGLSTADQLRRGKYLRSDETLINGWRKRNTPRIGICISGGSYSERGYSRDMPAKYGEVIARRFGPFMDLTHQGQWDSYADTAAAIEAMDLVLSVDTSLAHLSGALGTNTILMLSTDPDFRWGKHLSTTPWYPSMTIVRQKSFLDWQSVVDQVSRIMEARLNKLAAE